MSKIVLVLVIIVIVLLIAGGVAYFIAFPKASTPSKNGFPANNPNPSASQTLPAPFTIQGMVVETERVGNGSVVTKAGDKVTVNYEGSFADGKKFDSSYDRKDPLVFTIGQKGIIQGFSLGVTGMKLGEKRKLTVPPELGYGAKGWLTIPRNATLIFEVELLKIN